MAIRSPSAMNTQPWEFLVFGGDIAEKIAKENAEELQKGTMPDPDHQGAGSEFVGHASSAGDFLRGAESHTRTTTRR